jgi:hypothetical protein
VDSQIAYVETLLRLESQHEDLLARLEELDKRVVSVLTEYQRPGDPKPVRFSEQDLALTPDQEETDWRPLPSIDDDLGDHLVS